MQQLLCAWLSLLLGICGAPQRTVLGAPPSRELRHHAHPHWKTRLLIVTAYVVDRHAHGCRTYSAATASGTRATRSTIAVDTNIFPFGTKFRIPNYGYGIARDRGGLISGAHIDAAMLSCNEALTWGAPRLRVAYLLPSP